MKTEQIVQELIDRMSNHKLKKIVKDMGQAAADAKVMGLDGVYLHGHEGYLLEQMTNPAFNRRKLGHYADWKRFEKDYDRRGEAMMLRFLLLVVDTGFMSARTFARVES